MDQSKKIANEYYLEKNGSIKKQNHSVVLYTGNR